MLNHYPYKHYNLKYFSISFTSSSGISKNWIASLNAGSNNLATVIADKKINTPAILIIGDVVSLYKDIYNFNCFS